MNVRQILNILGKILIVLSAFMSTSFIVMVSFHEMDLLLPMTASILTILCTGSALLLLGIKRREGLRFKDAYIIVSLAWFIMGLAGSLPFYLSGAIPSFIDALFESVSGFTTTGSSILTDIEVVPKTILYWRSLTHWIGGMGIIVLVVAIMPTLKIAGYQLFSLESSGNVTQKIIPRTNDIARKLWLVYISMTFILFLLLLTGGLDIFESICHAFGTVATGGYSTKNASVGYYSAYVQYIIMIFMLLAGINFSLYLLILRGNLKTVFRNTELKAFILIILSVGLFISAILYFDQGLSLELSFRQSFFQVISIITATGFITADYLQWNESAWMLILFLMFIGACVGSTGGGIKVVRHVVAIKNIKRHFQKQLHPNSIRPVRINGRAISDENVNATVTFIYSYLVIVMLGAVFLTAIGVDQRTALGAVLTTMGGIGPGIGEVGPVGNFANIPDLGKVLLTFLMVLGRLEIMTILILFTRSFWKT